VTQKCGITGGSCEQSCLTGGVFGPCLPKGGSVIKYQDRSPQLRRLRQCLPRPAPCAASLHQQQVRSGSVREGFFDIDPVTFGCESTCAGNVCSTGSTLVTLTSPPLAESGFVFQALSSGGSFAPLRPTRFGGPDQRDRTATTPCSVEDPPPPIPTKAVSSSSTHKHIGGFPAAIH